eukprot:m.97482 g.97482  ORF g.97482 m.97482 type:complete len:218 (+) comp12497_c0_seq4:80-733(+)
MFYFTRVCGVTIVWCVILPIQYRTHSLTLLECRLETGQFVFVLASVDPPPQAFDPSDQILVTPMKYSADSMLEECDYSKFPLNLQAYHKTSFSQAQVKSLLRHCVEGQFIAASPNKDSNKYILGLKLGDQVHQTGLRLSKTQSGSTMFVMEQGSRQFETMTNAASYLSKKITLSMEEQHQSSMGIATNTVHLSPSSTHNNNTSSVGHDFVEGDDTEI